MFGYIAVNKSEMKFREFDIYHSYYCGICRELKKKYGGLGQLSLSYDMTFLAILLTGLYEPETRVGSCKCVAHPFESHETRNNIFTEYAADMNMLFACYKCQDDWEDERKFGKYAYGRMLEAKAGRLKKEYADKVRTISLMMQDFSDAERSGDADIDTLAGLFGRIMAEIMAAREDEWADNLRRLGFFLGKFIYLCDAYEDVEKDIRKGMPNPLKQKFESPDFEEECKTILMMMISECCKEFEKLPILENVEILRNILYSGVWGRYEIVHEKRQQSQSQVTALDN
ncbi:MAG: hypothetical protein HFH92_05525 [Lachnospiraceae bacterium]|uniref:DUF5685 family protein n=1 Tax=uncultured Acetatifactor sp. TaxID=1671927 RepID=UPI00260AA834|nr:DUF5685 family protein [uncultured Acetatifactor sp.]MCI8788559.1 hypothetical protein [Lachnospiraceae bacterium]